MSQAISRRCRQRQHRMCVAYRCACSCRHTWRGQVPVPIVAAGSDRRMFAFLPR